MFKIHYHQSLFTGKVKASVRVTLSRQIVHHGLEYDFIGIASDNPSWLQRSWSRSDLSITRKMCAHLRSRRPNGLLHRRATGGWRGNVYPPIRYHPCQLSSGTLYLGCAVNIRSKYGKPPASPSRGGEAGVGMFPLHKWVKVESSPTPRTRVRAVRERFFI